jgi:hypothetical protein
VLDQRVIGDEKVRKARILFHVVWVQTVCVPHYHSPRRALSIPARKKTGPHPRGD